MTQDLHTDPSWSLIHLNTIVETKDLSTLQQAARCDMWVGVLSARRKTERRLKSDAEGMFYMDIEEALCAETKLNTRATANLCDVQTLCTFKTDIGGRPAVFYNSRWKDPPETYTCLWLCDGNNYYTGRWAPLQRDQVAEWLNGSPCTFIYECDSAGEYLEGCGEDDKHYHLASCAKGETLPDAELLSLLIVNGVKVAFKWHCAQSNKEYVELQMPPRDITDRSSLCCQIDWVTNLILDAIGRDMMPQQLYRELLRGDILTGTIFRRFILAQRILRQAEVNPQSRPALPDCTTHRLWALWDEMMDLTVTLVRDQRAKNRKVTNAFFGSILDNQYQYPDLLLSALSVSTVCHRAYNVLRANWSKLNIDAHLQECIVIQSIQILGRPRNPLANTATQFLAEILVETPSVKQFLKPASKLNLLTRISNTSEPCFIIKTLYLQSFLAEFNVAHQQTLRTKCINFLDHQDPVVRLWSLLLAKPRPAAECPALRTRLEELLTDAGPKVRAAAVEAWCASYSQQTATQQKDMIISKLLPVANANSSSFVRRELSHALNVIAADRTPEMITICKQEIANLSQPSTSGRGRGRGNARRGSRSNPSDSILANAWRLMVALQADPDQEVATSMQSVVAFIKQCADEQMSERGKRKKKTPVIVGDCPLPARVPLLERLCRDLLEIKPAEVAVRVDSMENNDPRVLNSSLPIGPRNPALPLLNHQLKSLKVHEAPEMVRFGSNRQLFTAFKDHVTWQNLTDGNDKTHILKHPVVTGSLFRVTALLPDIPLRSSSLLIGYNDGTIRLWQIPTTQTEPTLFTTWQGLPDCRNITAYGISMTSIEDRKLIIGGDAKHLRQWDLVTGSALGNVAVGTNRAVTALTSNGVFNIAAGLDDGSVRLYDTRAEANGRVAVGPRHSNPVRTVSLRTDGLNMISACRGGSIHLLDLRRMIPPLKRWSWSRTPTGVTIHPQLDLMAFGAETSLELYSTGGEQKYVLEEGSCCVDFHPTETVLASGNTQEKAVRLYGEWVE